MEYKDTIYKIYTIEFGHRCTTDKPVFQTYNKQRAIAYANNMRKTGAPIVCLEAVERTLVRF